MKFKFFFSFLSSKYLILFVTYFSISICGFSQLKIIFRYDDFYLIDNSFQDSLLKLFEKNDVPLSLGVIPFNSQIEEKPIFDLSDKKLNFLKVEHSLNKIEICQHGFNHFRNSSSEFSGLSKALQETKIKKGKYFLDSIFEPNITTFIPPWNKYDSVTLNILEKYRYTVVSGDVFQPYFSNKIKFIPCTYHTIVGLLELIMQKKEKDALLVVMFHKYDFLGHGLKDETKLSDLSYLDEVLKYVKQNSIPCYTFSSLEKNGENLDYDRLIENSKPHDGLLSKKFEHLYIKSEMSWLLKLDFLAWFILCLSCFLTGRKIHSTLTKRKAKKIICSIFIFGFIILCFFLLRFPLTLKKQILFFSILFFLIAFLKLKNLYHFKNFRK